MGFKLCVITSDAKGLLEWQHDVYPQDTDVIIEQDLSTAKPISAYKCQLILRFLVVQLLAVKSYMQCVLILFGVEPEKMLISVCVSLNMAGVSCVTAVKGCKPRV